MENPGEDSVLRCRKCRKCFINSTCLYTMTADDVSVASCSVWHVNVDALPRWILSSVHQAQWTVGKLNCQNCGARLGGFNFLNHGRCPCGQESRVHLSKSRVDRDFAVVLRRSWAEPGPRAFQRDRYTEDRHHPKLVSHPITSHQEGFYPLTDSRAIQFPASHTPCGAPHRTAALCSVRHEGGSEGSERTAPDLPFTLLQREGASSELTAFSAELVPSPCYYGSTVSGASGLPGEAASDSPSRRTSVPPSSEEEREEPQARALTPPPSVTPPRNRLSRRERNRAKSERRRQRKRERWLQQEQFKRERGVLLDSEEEEEEQEAERQDGCRCAVCLEVYYAPYSCQPCGHVFCEPCLRTLARNRPRHTPCPLCRTPISHTLFQKDLNQRARTCFPKVYHIRKQNFQNAACAKWPLPKGKKHFQILWAGQQRASPSVFTLDALGLGDLRDWLFVVDQLLVYNHSVNWFLTLLVLGFFLCFFFFS